MNGPMNGPRKIMGRKFTSMAVERIVAEPVSLARYQARANPTTELPNMEAAWLLQRTKNFFKTISPC
jgi:hypothetical protein